MISQKEGRLEYIDVVRRQGGEIHVLGRGEEIISSDSTSYMAYHAIADYPIRPLYALKKFFTFPP